MKTKSPDLVRSQRAFFSFLVYRAILGTAISLAIAALLLWLDVGGIASLIARAGQSWMWIGLFCFDIWVTVTGMTIAIGIWGLGEWRDPPD
ncbi:hypothetical protein L2D14_08640 [Thalassospiraceae bacterium LMO-JJ14]|nr:hypothetical protein L2D14_08640 [Thalassospiraceae bacterium LMO-JJ14]